MTEQRSVLSCSCGVVTIEVEKAPFIATQCYCNSCRDAGTRMQALPGSPVVMEADGGTPFLLYRKDRVRFLTGQDRLRAFRLTPGAPTRRVIAGCCNTPLFLEFQGGHWLSLYAALWPKAHLPAMDVRTMVGDLPEGTVLSAGPPSGRLPTFGFYGRLLAAWIAMGFRVPKVEVPGEELSLPAAGESSL